MPFKKGSPGRPKGTKHGEGQNKNAHLDVCRNPKTWEKNTSKKTLDQDQVDYYINNDLPLEELYDEMKLYDYSWKNGNRTGSYNLNMQMKAKKDRENGE